jgi:signal transduction histidine kinase/DNA-binding NarL/FixJ family response regulator
MVADTKHCTILMVDDEEANLDLLEGFLATEGYNSLVRTCDSRQAVSLFESHAPDLVLLDLHMPSLDGFAVLREIRERTPADVYLPVLVLTADSTPAARERALSGGARDFLTKPLDATEVLLRVHNLLETRLLHQWQREARVRAEAAERRSALLAQASHLLGASLDSTTTLSHFARLLVPAYADACTVLLPDGERWAPAGIVHLHDPVETACRAILDGAGLLSLASSVLSGEHAVEIPGESLGLESGMAWVLIAPLRIKGRAIGGLVLIRCNDRGFSTDDVRLAEELATRAAMAVENARLFAETELANRARDRMLSVVAHDLRNPLTVVSMYAEMLLSLSPEGEEDYQKKAARSISQTSARMQRLIEDLVDVSRLRGGTFRVDRCEHGVVGLLEEAEAMLRPLAVSANVDLVLLRDSGADTSIEIDGARLLQVLSNLVGNSLKFTPEGGRIILAARGAPDRLHLSVEDTGCGIPADQLPHIFGAFWQARDGDRRGIGLGLWISRAIVEAHGGRIWVESREGAGAAFHVSLPWRADSVELEKADVPAEGMGQPTHPPAWAPV